MRLLCCLFVLAAAVPAIAGAAPDPVEPLRGAAIEASQPSASLPGVEEVFVEAPEPRYVAPNKRDRIGRVWAPVFINGQGPFRLVLDTGASASAVIPSVVTRLGMSTANTRMMRLHGVTGTALTPSIAVDSLEVGDLLLEGKQLPVVPDAFGGAEGVLGAEGLIDKRIVVDFRKDEISIMRSRKQRAAPGFSEIPLTLGKHRLPSFDVTIGRVRVKAILDTGGQATVGNRALRDLLKRRAADVGLTQEIIGVTLDVARGEVVPIPTMNIGSIEVRGLRLMFGDMFIFERWGLTREPVLLVGMDVIGSFDAMVIDYPKRQLQIRARGGV
jgi:predicted aspartyl protease